MDPKIANFSPNLTLKSSLFAKFPPNIATFRHFQAVNFGGYSPVSINQPRSFNFQAQKILMVGLNRSDRLTIFEKKFLWSLNRYSRLIIFQKNCKSCTINAKSENQSHLHIWSDYFPTYKRMKVSRFSLIERENSKLMNKWSLNGFGHSKMFRKKIYGRLIETVA